MIVLRTTGTLLTVHDGGVGVGDTASVTTLSTYCGEVRSAESGDTPAAESSVPRPFLLSLLPTEPLLLDLWFCAFSLRLMSDLTLAILASVLRGNFVMTMRELVRRCLSSSIWESVRVSPWERARSGALALRGTAKAKAPRGGLDRDDSPGSWSI